MTKKPNNPKSEARASAGSGKQRVAEVSATSARQKGIQAEAERKDDTAMRGKNKDEEKKDQAGSSRKQEKPLPKPVQPKPGHEHMRESAAR